MQIVFFPTADCFNTILVLGRTVKENQSGQGHCADGERGEEA